MATAPGLIAMCAGYEDGNWRDEQLAAHAMEWLPEFSLKYSEWEALGPMNAVKLLKKAARQVYSSENFSLRGEFGELFLHIILRQVFDTIPAICKIHYKDSRNDTVKGFDCVHVVDIGDSLELWLGEVKFYKSATKAIADVVNELQSHVGKNYLRDEFSAIINKIDDKWPHAEKLKILIDENTSLDDIFSAVCVPILITYDSSAIASSTMVCATYKNLFEKEVRKIWGNFKNKKLPNNIRIELLVLPLKSKESLQEKLHKELQRWN